MNFTQLLYLMYIVLLPVDQVEAYAITVRGFHISILDIMLVLLLYLVLGKQFVERGRPGEFILKVCLCLLIALPISAISFMYLPPENILYDVKISLVILEFTALIYITSAVVRDFTYLKKVLIAFSISCLFVSVVTVLKSIGWDIPGHTRVMVSQLGPFMLGCTGIMQHVLGFSVMICVVYPFLLNNYLFQPAFKRNMFFMLVLLAAVISYSRGLWLAIGLQSYIYLMLWVFSRRDVVKRGVGVVLFSGLTWGLWFYSSEIYTFLTHIRTSTVTGRLQGYLEGITLSVSSPVYFLFGAGKGNFITQYGEGSTMVHNFILDLLVSKGLITVMAVGTAFYLIIHKLWTIYRDHSVEYKKSSLAFLAAFVGLFAIGMTAPIFSSIHFWTFIAITCAYLQLQPMVMKWER